MVIRTILQHKCSENHLFLIYMICFGHHQAILHKYNIYNVWPKHVPYVRNKLILEHLRCCISLIGTEDVNYVLLYLHTAYSPPSARSWRNIIHCLLIRFVAELN